MTTLTLRKVIFREQLPKLISLIMEKYRKYKISRRSRDYYSHLMLFLWLLYNHSKFGQLFPGSTSEHPAPAFFKRKHQGRKGF